MSPIRIVIADDHADFRSMLGEILSDEADIELVGEASDPDETVDVVQRLRPDVLLLDIRMGGRDVLDIVAELTQRTPETGIIAMSASADLNAEALARGARAFVRKSGKVGAFLDGIRGLVDSP